MARKRCFQYIQTWIPIQLRIEILIKICPLLNSFRSSGQEATNCAYCKGDPTALEEDAFSLLDYLWLLHKMCCPRNRKYLHSMSYSFLSKIYKSYIIGTWLGYSFCFPKDSFHSWSHNALNILLHCIINDILNEADFIVLPFYSFFPQNSIHLQWHLSRTKGSLDLSCVCIQLLISKLEGLPTVSIFSDF